MGNVIDITNRLPQPEANEMTIEEIIKMTDDLIAQLN